MKFVKNLFRKKTKASSDEKIERLVNELIEELKKDGKSIGIPDIGKDFGSLTVFVHRLGTEDEEIALSANSWEVRVKPTFKKF